MRCARPLSAISDLLPKQVHYLNGQTSSAAIHGAFSTLEVSTSFHDTEKAAVVSTLQQGPQATIKGIDTDCVIHT